MLKVTKLATAMLLCFFFLQSSESQIVKLVPPRISRETILEKIVCTRPMREGKFNISLEQRGNKTIVNCYGHGGSGWTTLFGSVNKAIELFEKTYPNKANPIRVIGSGCMGLTTAIELIRLGYQVAGIFTKDFYDSPSWRAAGYFGLVSIKTSPKEQDDLNKIGLNTFLTYQQIDSGKHPYINKEAIKFMPVYCNSDIESGVEGLETCGMIPPREYVSLDFGNGIIHHGYIKYMTYFMNTTILMRQLIAETQRLGINIESKEVKSFDDVVETAIFNCSGLGGRELNLDENMIPVRGHLVTLNDASGNAHMDYMIYTKVKQNGKDEYIYMFPKSVSVTSKNTEGISCVGVLGGTFIPDVDKLSTFEQEKLDEIEFKRMLDRNSEFFQGHLFND